MKKEFLDYLEDIIEAMNNAMKFVEDLEFDDFVKDSRTNYAAVRALEIVGEAAKKIPDRVKASYPDIPWRDMAGMRDKLIHEYFGVNLDAVWRAATKELPRIKPLIEKILSELENDK